jgi:hypothetical protein
VFRGYVICRNTSLRQARFKIESLAGYCPIKFAGSDMVGVSILWVLLFSKNHNLGVLVCGPISEFGPILTSRDFCLFIRFSCVSCLYEHPPSILCQLNIITKLIRLDIST